jgi:uncharacterized protein YprB with RNaseH-like and TPR domain
MEIIKKKHQMNYYTSRLMNRYFEGMKVGVFDIETMGLNPALTEVILAGFLEINPDGSAEATQYFANSRADEPELLYAVFEEFKKYDILLTFNGKHFDLPFVCRRAELNDLKEFRPGCYNLDLYLVLHGHSNLKQIIKSLKQKNVEDYMGFHIERKDEISGAESILLYEAYVEEKDPDLTEALKQKILLHNHDDLLQLYRILPVIQQTDIHRAMSYLGFPVSAANGWPQLNIGRIRVDNKGLTVTGTYGGPAISYTSYDSGMAPYSCHFTPEGEFQFLFYTHRHKGSHYIELKSLLNPAHLEAMTVYPGYVNGFLILTEGTQTNYLEINMFVQIFLQQFMEQISCPSSVTEAEEQISFI